MTRMTIWLHPTKSTVPIREFLLIQIDHLNSITFPETEELQCSIFRCIPAGAPVDASTLSRQQMRSNSQIWRSGSHKAWRTFTEDCADPYIAAYWKSHCRYASLHSTVLQLLCTASSILLLSCLLLWRLCHLWPPHTHSVVRWRQVTHGSITDLIRLHPLEFLPLSFFLIHFFLLFVHPKIAAPL